MVDLTEAPIPVHDDLATATLGSFSFVSNDSADDSQSDAAVEHLSEQEHDDGLDLSLQYLLILNKNANLSLINI